MHNLRPELYTAKCCRGPCVPWFLLMLAACIVMTVGPTRCSQLLVPSRFQGTNVTLDISCPRVSVGNITFEGRYLSSHKQDFFGGIPFALPPVAARRFRRPVALRDPSQPLLLSVKAFGKQCMQTTWTQQTRDQTSEDCLSLNVLRPAQLDETLLPVMVWIHGGGFHAGNGNYNGSDVVARSVARRTPIIFVSFNYRLAAWGFPQGDEATTQDALNLGLRDQVAALVWVRDHISNFGGDPARVTLYGESAGAISASLHLFNADSASLFSQAIFISGSPSTLPVYPSRTRAGNFLQFAGHAGCADATLSLECLRTVSLDSLVHAHDQVMNHPSVDLGIFTGFPWAPTIDGDLIPDEPRRLLHSGAFSRQPFISGCNLDEGTIFAPYWLDTPADIEDILAPALGQAVASTLVGMYNGSSLRSPYNLGKTKLDPVYGREFTRAAAIAGDVLFHAFRREMNAVADRWGTTTWAYHFTDNVLVANNSPSGVYHGISLGYFFGTILQYTDRPDVTELVAKGMDYFLSFATSGDPNDSHGLVRPYWPVHTDSQRQAPRILELHSSGLSAVDDLYRLEQLDFILRS